MVFVAETTDAPVAVAGHSGAACARVHADQIGPAEPALPRLSPAPAGRVSDLIRRDPLMPAYHVGSNAEHTLNTLRYADRLQEIGGSRVSGAAGKGKETLLREGDWDDCGSLPSLAKWKAR